MNTSTAQAQLDALDHLRNELREEIKSQQAESDSTSSTSLLGIAGTTDVNKTIHYEHPSDSESSDSSDSSSSEDSSSSDSWIPTTRTKSKGKKGKRLSRKKLSKPNLSPTPTHMLRLWPQSFPQCLPYFISGSYPQLTLPTNYYV